MTTLREAADAGIQAQVAHDLSDWRKFIANARVAYYTHAFTTNFGFRLIDAVGVAASELDTARAEIERLRATIKTLCSAIGDWSRPTGANGMTSVPETHPLVKASHTAARTLSPDTTEGGHDRD